MAPLADAMRLIHRDHRHVHPAQHVLCPGRGQPFRRKIKQLQRVVGDGGPDRFGLFFGVARGQRAGFDPGGPQGAHLISHQRDQWRDHHRHTGPHQRRQLKAQGFPTPRRHDRQHVASGGNRLDDLLLARAKGIKAEYIAQKRGGFGHLAPSVSGRLLSVGPAAS